MGEGCGEEVTAPIRALQTLKWVFMEHPHIAPGETVIQLSYSVPDVTQLALLWECLLTRTKYIKIVSYLLSQNSEFSRTPSMKICVEHLILCRPLESIFFYEQYNKKYSDKQLHPQWTAKSLI